MGERNFPQGHNHDPDNPESASADIQNKLYEFYSDKMTPGQVLRVSGKMPRTFSSQPEGLWQIYSISSQPEELWQQIDSITPRSQLITLYSFELQEDGNMGISTFSRVVNPKSEEENSERLREAVAADDKEKIEEIFLEEVNTAIEMGHALLQTEEFGPPQDLTGKFFSQQEAEELYADLKKAVPFSERPAPQEISADTKGSLLAEITTRAQQGEDFPPFYFNALKSKKDPTVVFLVTTIKKSGRFSEEDGEGSVKLAEVSKVLNYHSANMRAIIYSVLLTPDQRIKVRKDFLASEEFRELEELNREVRKAGRTSDRQRKESAHKAQLKKEKEVLKVYAEARRLGLDIISEEEAKKLLRDLEDSVAFDPKDYLYPVKKL